MPVSKRACQKSFILGAMAVTVVSFQNFSPVTIEDLRPEMSTARAAHGSVRLNDRGDQDIREFAPTRPLDFDPPSLAVPDSGHDLGTIGLNWLGKQTDLMTDGADRRLLIDVNKRLNRWTKFTPVEGEPWPEAGDGDKTRDPSSINSDGGSGDGGDTSGDDANPQPKMQKSFQDMFSLAPKSVHFSQLNRFEMRFASDTQLSCLVGSGGLDLDFQQPIHPRMDVGLRHQAAGQTNTLHIQYNW